MCLLTRQIKPIITKKDMIVIKKLKVEEEYSTIYKKHLIAYFSYYWWGKPFQYIPEALYITILDITRALPKHTSSFGNVDINYYKRGSLMNRKLTVVKQGYHFVIEGSESYKEIGDTKNLFKFLVPKGSQVFLGKTGCGVSNQIIMLKP
jgi:hypothetical protein